MEASTIAPSQPSALRRVFDTPLYRGAAIALFLSGVGTSAAAPQIVLFLVRDLGAALPIAGLYYLTSLVAPIAGYLVGSYSDRSGIRLSLFRICAIAGFFGWAGIALSTQVWMPFALSAMVLAFSGAAASQIFAAVHDDLSRSPSHTDESVVAIIRMALTVGWVVGPVAGAWLAAGTSLRTMLWGTALCFLLQIAPLGTMNVSAPKKKTGGENPTENAEVRGWRPLLPLLAFTGLFILVYAGESIKYGFLPLYMDEYLKLDATTRGAVIGIQPLVELLIMPFSVILGRSVGMLWLMCIAAGLGVAANICFAAWPNATGMFAGQILMGGVWGVFAALGIIVAQRLLPTAVATASAIFMSSSAVSTALGGVTGGVGVAVVGLPHVFWFPAGFSLLAVLGLAVMARSGRMLSKG